MQPTNSKNSASNSQTVNSIEKEYQDFVYIVSHDFQAPVRHLKNFTRFLVESRGDPNEEEQEYIKHIESALQKLEEMQSALLTLSRLSTNKESWAPINCNDIISRILEKYEGHDAEIGPLPNIKGDENLIQTLFHQLIDNALKFHEPDTTNKKINISAISTDTHVEFTITDNGIGIPDRNQEHIFQIFKRLHPEDYPGIGAGLTIAKKITKLHNGDLWVNTENDKTIFKFSILQ